MQRSHQNHDDDWKQHLNRFVFFKVIATRKNMAGLEVLFSCVSGAITRPQDVVVCFVHWEFVQNGYKCLGTGDEVRLHNNNINKLRCVR